MKNSIDRRHFLKTTGVLTAGVSLAGWSSAARADEKLADGAPHAEKLGWRLGCQAYSFNRFTFHEALDKIAAVGLHYVEAYPGQKLSAEQPGVRIGPELNAEQRRELLKRLADKNIQLVNYGVCGLQKEEGACRKTFDFAKEMGIETLVSEPAPEALDTIEKLCDEYKINLAIHNHPKPSRYWNYTTVLEACQGRSKHVGACADTGHWMRSGIHPVEALQKLEGRIISFHFKDLNKFGIRSAHDMPWGTGVGNVDAMLAEIHRQGLKAVFSIEYEHNWLNSLPEIAKSVKYFDQVAARYA